MNRRLLALLLGLACLVAALRDAVAGDPPRRAVFALIVTNNHSIALGRPDLHYADDDGVKYAEVFRMLAPETNVHLLTELDRDSALLFPHLRGKLRPPTRAEVTATTATIARAAAEAQGQGVEVDFYFVFAGHGDVDRGKGFLELRDGRFTSDDVEALLKAVPSTRSHVILDSCNSFFVLNARKPGGRRVAVSDEATKSLHDRLPNVGVFLSTSAEAEVFEWSELQSGIFSHAVRSGITGAADANRDGVVSYDELRAFVDLASSQVKNPLYRPRVFARGPRGRGDQPIFALTGVTGRRVMLDAAPRVRLTVRDVDELPWIDAHKEEGSPMVLWLPQRIAARASIEEREVGEAGDRVLRRRTLEGMPEASEIRLADATPIAPSPSMRSADDVLRKLFAAPFGPRALAAYEADAARTPAPVYGVSHEDAERMSLLLAQVADIDKGERRVGGAVLLALGAASVGGGIGALALGPRGTANQVPSYMLIGTGGLSLTFGGLKLFRLSDGERLHEDFVRAMAAASPAGAAKVVADTERRLFELAGDYRRDRRILRGVGITAAALSTVGLVVSAVPGTGIQDRGQFAIASGGAAIVGVVGIVQSFVPTPIERMADLWSTDPSLTRVPRVSLAPFVGPGALGLRGTF
ncbi:MAG: hypothetical protein QM820_20900 [Minicystis sp.]